MTYIESRVEQLETRKLFAATSLPLSHALLYQAEESSPDHAPVITAPLKAAAKKKPPKIYPSVKGKWFGEWEVDSGFFHRDYDIKLEFKSVSRDSKTATGTLTVKKRGDDDDYVGGWKGITYTKTGEFNYTLKKHGDKIKIVGQLNSDNTFAFGYIRIDWDHGGYDKGDFHVDKV